MLIHIFDDHCVVEPWASEALDLGLCFIVIFHAMLRLRFDLPVVSGRENCSTCVPLAENTTELWL